MTTVGEPALSDEVTAQLYTLSVRQARAMALAMAFLVVFLAATWWVRLALPDFADAYEPLYSYAPCLTALAFVMLRQRRTSPMVYMPMWRVPSRRLLAMAPGRETPAKVLNVRGTVLVLPDGEHLRVSQMPAAVREVVVRTGRVRLLGPDDRDRLAVRVDGLGTAWSARRVRPVPGTAAQPTGEPIPSMWVRFLVGQIRIAFFAGITLAVWGLILVATPGPWWDFLEAASYGFFAVAAGLRFHYLRRLRPIGTWRQAEATAPSWRVRRNGLAEGTVTVSFPDGRRFTVQLERVPLDLFANVVREKSLWVAQNQVVGYPDYPIVAAARFTPHDR